MITVCTGYSEDVIPHLKMTLGASNGCPRAFAADAIFFDQRGTRFHTDLWMLEAEGLLKDGCAVLADNVLKPGAPHFLWYLQQSPKYASGWWFGTFFIFPYIGNKLLGIIPSDFPIFHRVFSSTRI